MGKGVWEQDALGKLLNVPGEGLEQREGKGQACKQGPGREGPRGKLTSFEFFPECSEELQKNFNQALIRFMLLMLKSFLYSPPLSNIVTFILFPLFVSDILNFSFVHLVCS